MGWQELLETARSGVPTLVLTLGDLDISSIWQLVIKGDPQWACDTFDAGVADARADMQNLRSQIKRLVGTSNKADSKLAQVAASPIQPIQPVEISHSARGVSSAAV